MTRTLLIRDVPEPIHEALLAKAQRAGISLPAYALRVLERDAGQSSLPEAANTAVPHAAQSSVTRGRL